MTNNDSSSRDRSIQRSLEFEALCDEFEAAYVEGNRPSIEAFLDRVEGSEKRSLLIELIAIELQYLQQREESIELVDYQDRFPGLSMAILDECRKQAVGSTPAPSGKATDVPVSKTDGIRSTESVLSTQSSGKLIVGRYKLLQRIGEGGMGTVWMAEQRDPIHRRVAIKLIRVDRVGSKTVLNRFEAERQAIAMMDHPNISKLLDAGSTEDGSPFFVMELVKGVPLTEYCDQHRLSVPDRLQLFTQICSAVQHAHQKGIIHRDLKPSNILVEEHDGRPLPKVIDFGLAKAISGLQLTDKTLFTGFGSVIGTPLYMAPEQADFNAVDIDTRADIYSLGVILFELLTGSTPLTNDSIKKAALDVLLRLIREEEAPPPSSRLSSMETIPSVAANRQSEPSKLGRFVKGELDWIVMKSLAKDRDRRYESAGGFAKDIERFLEHEPVLAGPPGTAYKFRKFIQRNKRLVIGGSLLLLTLIGGIVGTTLGLFEANRQKGIAQSKQNEAEAERSLALIAKKRALEYRDKALRALRASVDEDIHMLLGGRETLGPNERAYLEAIANRWQEFVRSESDDEDSLKVRSTGHIMLGYLWALLGESDSAIREIESSKEIWSKLVKKDPSNLSYRTGLWFAYHSLGNQLSQLGKVDEAIEEYRASVRMNDLIASEFPNDSSHWSTGSRYNLALLLQKIGRMDEAIKESQGALEQQRTLTARNPNEKSSLVDLASCQNLHGELLQLIEHYEEAREQYQAAYETRKKLFDQDPNDPENIRELASSLNNIGLLLKELREPEKSLEKQRESRQLRTRVCDLLPGIPEYQYELAICQNNLVDILGQLGQFQEAKEVCEEWLLLSGKLSNQFLKVPDYRQQLARAHNTKGLILNEFEDSAGAHDAFAASRKTQEALVRDFPDVQEYAIDLGGSYCNYGNLVARDGKAEESLQWFDLAISTLKPIHDRGPGAMHVKQFLRNCYLGRAKAKTKLQNIEESAQDWERAIEFTAPEQRMQTRAQRVALNLEMGNVMEATKEVGELAKLDDWSAAEWYNFACVYAQASKLDADRRDEYAQLAVNLLEKSIQTGWEDFDHLKTDSDLDPVRERPEFLKLIGESERMKDFQEKQKPK